MTKQYLNRDETNFLVMLGVINDAIADFIQLENVKKLPLMDKNTLTWCKRINTNLSNQVLKPILLKLNQEELKKVMKANQNTKVICVPNDRANVYMDKAKKEAEKEEILLKKEYYESLIENAFYACNPCKCKSYEEMKHCKCRNTFFALNIPVFNEEAEKDMCPYAVQLREDFINE